MKELRIPGLRFTDVIGDVTYSNALFRFSDVHAKVFGGTLAARGYYNMDTREYRIYGNGKNLDSKRALRDFRFSCLVDMDINFECDGNPRNLYANGSFKSGKGHYSIIPFDSLEGRFSNRYRSLSFFDVKILAPFGNVTTDALSIINGKLNLGKIVLTDPDTGQEIILRQEKSGDDKVADDADKQKRKKQKKSRRNPSE